jgi:hypothetical protein
MSDNAVVSVGLKLNDLASFEVGAGVVLLTLKDAGKDARSISYRDLYDAMQSHLPQRLARYNISNPQPIVDELLKYLKDYQSVFTMAAH